MLAIFLIFVLSLVVAVLAVVKMIMNGKILAKPESNRMLIVLSGAEFQSAIYGDVSLIATHTTTAQGSSVIVKESLLPPKEIGWFERTFVYELFGRRYIGPPWRNSIGEFPMYYPEEIQSVTPGVHKNGMPRRYLDRTHTYKLVLKGVDFKGGFLIDLTFTVEVLITRPDIAWGKQGRFMDSFAQALSSAIRKVAIETDVITFIGKVSGEPTMDSVKKAVAGCKELMLAACYALNQQAGGDGHEIVKLDELSGYSVKAINYTDMEIKDPNSASRLKKLEELAQSITDAEISANEVKTAENRGKAEAAKVKALLEVLGDKLMARQIAANAHTAAMAGLAKSGASTLMIGSTGVSPIIDASGGKKPRQQDSDKGPK